MQVCLLCPCDAHAPKTVDDVKERTASLWAEGCVWDQRIACELQDIPGGNLGVTSRHILGVWLLWWLRRILNQKMRILPLPQVQFSPGTWQLSLNCFSWPYPHQASSDGAPGGTLSCIWGSPRRPHMSRCPGHWLLCQQMTIMPMLRIESPHGQ